jgi:hypothetical protein
MSTGTEELNQFLAMAAGASQSGSMDDVMLEDDEMLRMIENIRSQIIFKRGYNSATKPSAMTNKQQKSRKKAKAAKQARKKNRKK